MLGMVSLRFSCAVKPPAAQAATPSEPFPSGSDSESVRVRPAQDDVRLRHRPRRADRRNAPFCHAVVLDAADATGGALPRAAPKTAASTSKNPAPPSRAGDGGAGNEWT